MSLRMAPRAQTLVYGLSDLGLAILLAYYAVRMHQHCANGCRAPHNRSFTSITAGFLSGLSICPPFVAAGVRAAESSGLAQSLLFFGWFFVGTSIWFAPSVSLGLLRRFGAVATVARLALFLLAGYYAYLALVVLGRYFIHG